MDRFDQIKNSLKNCYRVDKYIIADLDTNEIERLAEFFIVTGDNSCIRVIDYDAGLVRLYMYGSEYLCGSDFYDPAEYINNLHDMMMVYEYCLTELRKLPMEQAIETDLFAYKTDIDRILTSGQLQSVTFPLEKYKELQARCDYLAHAYELEWKGVVSLNTCRQFSTIEELDAYVKEKNLTLPGNKETDDKRVFKLVRDRVSTEDDPLENIRDVDEDVLYRYRISKAPTLKDLKALEMADAKYMKEFVKLLKLSQQAKKFYQKIPYSRNDAQVNKAYGKIAKIEENIEKNSAHVMFLKD